MKILYLVHQFYPEYYTGTEKFLLQVSKMMQQSGNQVKVLTYSFEDDAKFDQQWRDILIRDYTYQGISVRAIKHKNIPEDIHVSLDHPAVNEFADEFIQKEKPDVVHVVHSMRVGGIAHKLPQMGVPYIVTLTDFFLLCPKYTLVTSQGSLCRGPKQGQVCKSMCPELSTKLITQRLRKGKALLSNAKAIISPSHFLASIFQEEYPDLNIQVINHGLIYRLLKRNTKIFEPNSPITFCYAGSINKHKGVHLLLEAFKQLKNKQATLKIYGSGPDAGYVDSIKKLATQDSRIEFRGVYQPHEVGEILTSIDVIVMPSLWHENAPIILREGLACNVPMIASNNGGAAETISHEQTGFLFEMGNSAELLSLLERVCKNPTILNDIKLGIDKEMVPTVEQEAYAYRLQYQNAIQLAGAITASNTNPAEAYR